MTRAIHTGYEDLLRHVLEHGTVKSDRTGTGTRSVFGPQLVYDLSAGFPLVTTKKVFTKGIIEELRWLLRGDTNVRSLQAEGVHIWDEWRRPYNLTRPAVLVERRSAIPAPYDGAFERKATFQAGSVDARLAGTWRHMMRRCYDPAHHRFSAYGGRGVTVHPRWHDIVTFVDDVKALPQWGYKLAEWDRFELDKDYYGSGQYGPETSVWLSTEENNLYTRTSQPVEVVDDEGAARLFVSQSAAARHVGMSTSSMSRFLSMDAPTILKGANRQFLGWEFRPASVPDDVLLRLELIPDGDLGPVYGAQWRAWPTSDGRRIDQISDVLTTLRTNPDSRRMIVSAWNVGELDNMALPPCHAFFQFYVADGRLSCKLTQRSADLFLGVPFNIASYALLTHMVAAQVGLEVGDFIWTGGDCHIYDNHHEQVLEQLSREVRPFPTLHLAPAPSLFAYTREHVVISGYDPHPAIKADVAV